MNSHFHKQIILCVSNVTVDAFGFDPLLPPLKLSYTRSKIVKCNMWNKANTSISSRPSLLLLLLIQQVRKMPLKSSFVCKLRKRPKFKKTINHNK